MVREYSPHLRKGALSGDRLSRWINDDPFIRSPKSSLTGSEGYQRWLEQREAKGRLAWWGALVCTTLFLVSAVASMGLSIKLHGVQEELKAARELADVCPISGNEFKVKEMESHVRELEVQVHRLLAEKSTQEAAVSNLNSELLAERNKSQEYGRQLLFCQELVKKQQQTEGESMSGAEGMVAVLQWVGSSWRFSGLILTLFAVHAAHAWSTVRWMRHKLAQAQSEAEQARERAAKAVEVGANLQHLAVRMYQLDQDNERVHEVARSVVGQVEREHAHVESLSLRLQGLQKINQELKGQLDEVAAHDAEIAGPAAGACLPGDDVQHEEVEAQGFKEGCGIGTKSGDDVGGSDGWDVSLGARAEGQGGVSNGGVMEAGECPAGDEVEEEMGAGDRTGLCTTEVARSQEQT